MAGEFDLINHYAPKGAPRSDVVLGPGDDAALLQVPPGKLLVATVDTLVSGRHFPDRTDAYDIGWKALAVNLSDLAAMGAEAAWATIALTLPAGMPNLEAWMAAFSAGIQDLAQEQGVAVVGGDLTSGPLSVTIQALGHVVPGKALRRDAAQPGDLVAVTGPLGDAALALHLLQQYPEPVPEVLLQRLNRPTPRLAAGRALAGMAHAAIDISDGLAADLGHILEASGVAAVIDTTKLPFSEAYLSHCPSDMQERFALSGGDDYELCICLPEAVLEAARAAVPELTVIGRVESGKNLQILNAHGELLEVASAGFDHFSGN